MITLKTSTSLSIIPYSLLLGIGLLYGVLILGLLLSASFLNMLSHKKTPFPITKKLLYSIFSLICLFQGVLTAWTILTQQSIHIGQFLILSPDKMAILWISTLILSSLYHLNLTQTTPLFATHHLKGVFITGSLWGLLGSSNPLIQLLSLEIGTLCLVMSHFKGQRRAKKLYLVLWSIASLIMWLSFLIQTHVLQLAFLDTRSLALSTSITFLTTSLFFLGVIIKLGHPPFQFPFDLMSKSSSFFFSASFFTHSLLFLMIGFHQFTPLLTTLTTMSIPTLLITSLSLLSILILIPIISAKSLKRLCFHLFLGHFPLFTCWFLVMPKQNALNSLTLQAVLLFMGLFLIAHLIHHESHSDQLTITPMLWKKKPLFGLLFIGIMGCLVGVPPFGFFTLRFQLIQAFIHEQLILAPLAVCFGYLICLLAMIKILYHSFWAEDPHYIPPPSSNRSHTTVPTLTSIMSLILLAQLFFSLNHYKDLPTITPTLSLSQKNPSSQSIVSQTVIKK